MQKVGLNLVDLAVALIMLGSIITAYKSGVIKLILNKASLIGGFILSALLTKPVSIGVAIAFNVKGKILDFVTGYVESSALSTQDSLSGIVRDMGVFGKFVAKALADVDINQMQQTLNFKQTLISTICGIVETPIMLMLNVCVFFLLLVIGGMLINLASGVLNGLVSALPLIGGINHILGGLFGILGGVVWSVLFIIAFSVISTFIGDSTFINLGMVQSSFVGNIVLDMFSSIGF